MTDSSDSISTTEFYDAIASNFDAMTEDELRFIKEKPFFRLVVDRFKIRTAIDAGCGTGFHCLLLSRLGVEVIAVDVSGEMLRILQQKACSIGKNVRMIQSAFTNLSTRITEPVNAIFCLGNTLPHILDDHELKTTLKEFESALNSGGLLVLQLLNYDRILQTRNEILSIRTAGDTTFTRSYRYLGDRIFFNIASESGRGTINTINQTTELRPLTSLQLSEFLTQAGFEDIRLYGGIRLQPFDPALSKDLVVHARRGERF